MCGLGQNDICRNIRNGPGGKSTSFECQLLDLLPVLIYTDIFNKVVSGGSEFFNHDTIGRISYAEDEETRIGAILDDLKYLVIVVFIFKSDLIVGGFLNSTP